MSMSSDSTVRTPHGGSNARDDATAGIEHRSGRPRRLGGGLESPLLSAPAVLVVVLAFFVPFGLLIAYSFWPTVDGVILHRWTLSNYTRFFSASAYWSIFLRSFAFVALASAITVGLTFPFAYFVATKVRPARRVMWVLVAIIPFWTSYLMRVFAWLNMFGDQGLINKLLMRIGLLGSPSTWFGFGKPAIVITFVYLLFPLAFLSIYIAIERMNPATLEAASDLGARPWRSLLSVTLPIARTGMMSGFVLCFISMIGDYATPQLIGGTDGTLYSNLIINQFGDSIQWGFGTALAVLLLVGILLLVVVLRLAVGKVESAGEYTKAFTPRRAPFLRGYSILYLLFLYVPPALLILLAFNSSETTGFPFEGFTTHWFAQVFANQAILDSLTLSVQIAAIAVSVSAVLGTLAATQLARARGRARSLSLTVIAVPMFLPSAVLGLALIIGLNQFGIERGVWTIIAGHLIITLPIVTMTVLVRLEGIDRNQELAAMDLGAKPWRAFVTVSVPQALPGIIAGAMIAFAVSLDEFIMTFLITGSQQTLPLYIFGSLRVRVSPELNAVAALMLATSFALLVVGGLIVFGRVPAAARRPAT
jgi:ABC-type spermidine/putrescine transport system permease subunit I